VQVESVNIGQVSVVEYRGKKVETGIFKHPVNESILVGETDVKRDNVVDRRYHGGVDKAVYAYSSDHYPFWRTKYPNLDWQLGMFGENLTIKGMDESKILVGSNYKVGRAVIQVCQPRQPCFKLGIRFKSQDVLKEFIGQPYSGVYFRVLENGLVSSGDSLRLDDEAIESPSILEVYRTLYHGCEDEELLNRIVQCKYLPKGIRERIAENAQ